MNHSYFVSYVFTRSEGFGKESGSGNNVMEVTFEIKTYEDVKLLQEWLIKEHEFASCIITNFILLGKTEGATN